MARFILPQSDPEDEPWAFASDIITKFLRITTEYQTVSRACQLEDYIEVVKCKNTKVFVTW